MGRMKRHDGTKWIDVAPSAQEFDAHQAEKATLTTEGHVQLSSAVDSESETLASTPKAVKQAYDLAQSAFTSASNGKQLVGNAITGVDDSVVIPTEPTFQQLADAIGQISTGKKWASGTSSTTNNELIVTGLGFAPTVIVIEQMYNDNGAIKVLRQTYLADSPLLEGKSGTYLTQFQWLNKTIVRKQHNSNMPSIENHDALITVGDYSFEAFIARSNELAHWIAFE